MNIITRILKKKDSPNVVIQTEMDLTLFRTAFDHVYFETVVNKMTDKAVQVMWKKYGADIIRKVDKKTIGNLTIKKLSALIAKELKP